MQQVEKHVAWAKTLQKMNLRHLFLSSFQIMTSINIRVQNLTSDFENIEKQSSYIPHFVRYTLTVDNICTICMKFSWWWWWCNNKISFIISNWHSISRVWRCVMETALWTSFWFLMTKPYQISTGHKASFGKCECFIVTCWKTYPGTSRFLWESFQVITVIWFPLWASPYPLIVHLGCKKVKCFSPQPTSCKVETSNFPSGFVWREPKFAYHGKIPAIWRLPWNWASTRNQVTVIISARIQAVSLWQHTMNRVQNKTQKVTSYNQHSWGPGIHKARRITAINACGWGKGH